MPDESSGPARPTVELDRVFRTHFAFVWRVLRRFGLSETEADDGVQEVFLVVAQKLETYEERGAMRAWLFTVARQVASHARRADSRRRRRDYLYPLPASAPDPYEMAERHEATVVVERFLNELGKESEDQALAFYLSEIEGLSATEIAAALGLPISTVYGRQRLSRREFQSFVRRHLGKERIR
jgi:RNA polymerase sigma-70 factor (ECF subfamily)